MTPTSVPLTPLPAHGRANDLRRRVALAVASWLIRPLMRPLDGEVDVTPLTGQTPAIIAMNHSSALDAIAIPVAVYRMCGRPVMTIARPTMRAGGFPHRLFNVVLEGALRSFSYTIPYYGAHDKVGACVAWLRLGRHLYLAPEGRMHSGPTLLPSRSGLARTALRAGAPIVPIGILGSAEVLPPRALIARPRRFRLRVGAAIEVTADAASTDAPAEIRHLSGVVMKALSRLCGKPVSAAQCSLD